MKNLPNSYQYYNETLSLPLYYSLKNSEQKYIIETILDLVRKMNKFSNIILGTAQFSSDYGISNTKEF